MYKNDFGMPTLVECADIYENCRLAEELGLDFVELNMNFPQYGIEQLENVKLLEKLKNEYGIYFTIHLDENLNVCDFNRAVSKAYTETAIRAVDVARKTGIPVLNMHMHHGIYLTLPDRKVYMYNEYNNEYMSAFEAFRDLVTSEVGDENIKICIENTDGFKDYEKKAIRMLLESKVFGLTWDIGHSAATGEIDEPFILDNKDRLSHFHIHDAKGEKNHLELGKGDICLKDRLRLSDELGARCVLETKTIDALRGSVGFLKANGYRN